MRAASVFVAAVVALCSAAAHADPAKRPLVFVNDITPTPGLESDATAVTSSLCGALARDKRLDVLCAPDVRQILGFAAMSAATGASPAVDKLEARLASLDFVVSGTLSARGKEDLVLVVVVGPRDLDGDVNAPSTSKPLIKLEEVAVGKSHRLLERLPELATRVSKPMLPTTTTNSPPAPLPMKK